MRKMTRSRAQRALACISLALSLVFACGLPVAADGGNAGENAASGQDANYYSEESAGMGDTQVDNTSSTVHSQDEVYQENNDGDDTYISNDGTVFRIPRNVDRDLAVYDYADLLKDEEEEELRVSIAVLGEKKDADIVILTTNDVPKDAFYSTDTSMRYARQFLVDNHFADNSFIAIIDMNNRVFWACGYGKYGTEKYAGWGQKVYDLVRSDMTNRNYFGAMKTYLHQIDRLDNPLLAAIPTPISLVISAVLAFIAMMGFILHHKSTQPSRATTPAVPVLKYKTLRHDKQHLGTTVHKRHIDRSSHSGGGGGGFSGGGFSSGSGGSHSGGGGHF